MIKEKVLTRIEKSAVSLTITVGADDTQKAYNSLLSEYSKKAQIKGFRPGKVPVSVLETKFGDSIKSEAAQETVEKSLHEAFDAIEEKPLPYAQPRMDENFSFEPGKDFTFTVRYDVYPSITLGTTKGLTVEEAQVSIGKEDLDRELSQIQDQNAIVTDVKDGAVKDKDMLTCNFVELDDAGNPKEDTRRNDFVLTVGKKENVYGLDEDLIGIKSGEEKVLTKKYPADYEYAEFAGKTVKVKVLISRIRRKDLPALDDELAQDVDSKFKTLDDLKKNIQERLEKSAKERVRAKMIDSLMEELVKTSTFELPESMILSQIYNQYERMVRQLGGNENTLLQLLAAQGKSPESLFEDWRPAAEKALRNQLVVQELIKSEKIEASETDIEAEYTKLSSESNMSVEDAKKYYKENKMEDYLRHEILERKLFDLLLSQAKIKKGDKLKYVDLLGQKA